MPSIYLGTLNTRDPLYEILYTGIFRDVKKDPCFHVNRMSSRRVYRYTEEKTGQSVVGKFYLIDDPNPERMERIRSEFENLRKVRGYGFDTFPNYVVRPILRDDRIGLALIEEYIRGRDLDHYLKQAVFPGDSDKLRRKLSLLASFLHKLHSRTEFEACADVGAICAYYEKIIGKLMMQGIVSASEMRKAMSVVETWLGRGILQEPRSVIVHADATPTNFIFTGKGGIVGIDLERMKTGDRVFDIGMVCGEIKHAFMWRTGNSFAAEPFIRHFLNEYTGRFRDAKGAFRSITARNPFYMALTELRIARNTYLDRGYREWLIREAFECLKWGVLIR